MAISRPKRLTFDLSAKVVYIGVLSIYQNIVFTETTKSIELKFHMETDYVEGSKFVTNVNGHMTNMAVMPI